MPLFIHAEHHYLHNIAYLHHLAGMAKTLIAYLGDVHQPVLMNADIHKHTKINDVAHGARKLHAGL